MKAPPDFGPKTFELCIDPLQKLGREPSVTFTVFYGDYFAFEVWGDMFYFCDSCHLHCESKPKKKLLTGSGTPKEMVKPTRIGKDTRLPRFMGSRTKGSVSGLDVNRA